MAKVEPLPISQIAYALERGMLQEDTPLFNNFSSNQASTAARMVGAFE